MINITMNDAINLIAQDIFDKVRSRFSNLKMGDENGKVTSDPLNARFFDFDFVIEGNNLGSVSISINERGSLKLFYSQGILEDVGPISQEMWFDFLREMRFFAKRRLLRFDTRDITKSNLDKQDFQYLAQTGTKEETMSESKMFGSSKTSYLPLEKTKLIIRHGHPVDESQRGSRSRNIKAIYIENSEGERFKYPFVHLAGAKAMQRHVANGGRPHDEHGKAIVNISEEIIQLNSFKRHVGNHDSMQTEANQIIERTTAKLEELRRQIESLCRQSYYESWKESIQPMNDGFDLDEVTMENYKNTFTRHSFAEDLTQYFPLIHKIMQETSEVELDEYVKEESNEECEVCEKDPCVCDKKKTEGFSAFEKWADSLVEGTLSDDVITKLKELFGNELLVGVDATSSVEALKNIGIDDKELFKALETLSDLNDQADAKSVILAWLEKENPDLAKELSDMSGTEKPVTQPTPPEDTTSAEPATAAPSTAPASTPPTGMGEQDIISSEGKKKKKKSSLLNIAEMVKSFYNKEDGTFTIGETGVITKVRKAFGDHAAELAEGLIESLKENNPRNHTESKCQECGMWESSCKCDNNEDIALEDILRLANLKK